MKFVVLTSTGLRHKYFAKTMCDNFNVEHVVFEDKGCTMELFQKELLYFQQYRGWRPNSYTWCQQGSINSKKIEDVIRETEPDYLLVFGTGLLKENIFSIPKAGSLNIHTGLTQHYRGVDSHIWAIMDDRLDLIGSTVHCIDKTIDAGYVLDQQVLKNIRQEDDVNDVFLKNCVLGINTMERVVRLLPSTDPQNVGRGKLYQKKDMNDGVICEANRKIPLLVEKAT